MDIKLTSDLKFSATIAGNQQETTSSFTKGLSNLNGYGGTKPGESGDYLVLAHMPNYLPWEITLDDGNTYYTSPLLNSYSSAGNATSGNKMSTWNYLLWRIMTVLIPRMIISVMMPTSPSLMPFRLSKVFHSREAMR